MAYALLIVEPPGQREARSEAEGRELYERMLRFSDELKERGLLTSRNRSTSDRSGARVRVQGDQASVVDGPFSEAKEMIGGILSIDLRVTRGGHRHRPGMPGRALGDGRGAGSSVRASPDSPSLP